VARTGAAGRFTEVEIELLNALGEDIVVSVSNSFLYEKVLRVSEENRLLYAISRDVGATLDLEVLIDRLLDHLRLIVPYDAAGLYLIRPDAAMVAWLGHRGYPEGSVESIRLKLGEGVVGRVTSSGSPEVVSDVLTDPDYVAARTETRSELVVPLVGSAGQVIGAFNVESDRERAFSNRDLERLESFASLAAVAIERESSRRMRQEKRRLDRELALARRIQEAFQPRRDPEIPGFQLWGRQLPSIEMSGDYFDVIQVSENDYGIVMADVSGKGVPAALIMASLRAALISEVRSRYAIRRVVSEVNRLLLESTEAQGFATFFYGVISVRDRVLTFVNAGHDPPLLRGVDGSLRRLVTGGTILGAFPDVEFRDERLVLEPGETLVLYTDGITEARDPAGEFFGTERLEALLQRSGERDPRQIGEDIFASVAAFVGEGPPDDDQTLLVVQVDSETD
jgi:sigma-B regulation protein RsbU (phosphoserine phosphatase)